MKPLEVGITGGIASGKTTVCNIFGVLGIPVYNADLRAKYIISNDQVVKNAIINEFGNESFLNGIYNTAHIASIVFNNEEKRLKLNAIVHPRVREDYNVWLSEQNTPFVLHEAALLIEAGIYKRMDKVIVVTAPEELRIQRVMKRDNMSYENAEKRIQAQLSQEEMLKFSDFEIVNDGKQSLITQAYQIYKVLKS